MIPVKVCGITRLDDARVCVEQGVAALGFVFAPSKRQVNVEAVFEISRKIPPFITKVGVFVDEDPLVIRDILKDCGLDLAQLHGMETLNACETLAGRVIKVFRAGVEPPDPVWREAPVRAVLVDSFSTVSAGGTGETFNWRNFEQYRDLGHPLILAGGLNPENIRQAIEIAKPDAVDLSSGVEREPGIKDPNKITKLMAMIRYHLKSSGCQ